MMNIATILSVHSKNDLVLDTLDSILHYMTKDVVLLVDGVYWKDWEDVPLPCYKLKGFNHGWWKSPYRNIVLSLYAASNQFKSADWVCYMEYDCLVGSSAFKKDLEEAEKEGVWLMGNDLRFKQEQEEGVNLDLLERIARGKFDEIVYFLGACLFYHRKFFEVAMKNEFFQRFLYFTNDFRRDFFPNYTAWDLTEHALPTIVKHFGGGLKQFASYNQNIGLWNGNYRRYPIRFRPELPYEDKYFLQASIMHPIKDLDNPIRKYHRAKRSMKK